MTDYLKRFRNKLMSCSLKHRILALVIVNMLLFWALFLWIVYVRLSSDFYLEFVQLSSQTVHQVDNSVTTSLSQLDNLAYQISLNQDIRTGLSYSKSGHELDKISTRTAALRYLETMSETVTGYNSVLVAGRNGEIYYKGKGYPNYSYNFTENPYMDKLLREKVSCFLPPHQAQYVFGEETAYSVLRGVYDFDSGNLLGYVLIDFDESYINNLVGARGNTGESTLFLLDGEKVIYSWKNQQFTPASENILTDQIAKKGPLNGFVDTPAGHLFCASEDNRLTGWHIVSASTLADYNVKMWASLSYILLFSILSLLISSVCASFIASAITKPVTTLSSLMEEVESGGFDARFNVQYDDEISRLGRSFNKMAGQLQTMIEKVYLSSIAEKNALIATLQAQINPHFLFNTLQSISDMAEKDGQDEITEMVGCLAASFRYVMGNRSRYARLYDELRNVENYIHLEKIRHGKKFEFSVAVPEDLFGTLLPRFVLQPLIENSVRHGIYDQLGTETIELRAYRKGQDVFIEVRDNGAGITPEKLADIREAIRFDPNGESNCALLSPASKTGGEYMALRNINWQFCLNYGPEYAIRIESGSAHGTVITLHVRAEDHPFAENPEQHIEKAGYHETKH